MVDRSGPPNARTQRVVVAQGDIFWASLPDPVRSGPGFARPVVIVQGDALNASRLATVVVVPLTSNLRWASAPGNVLLKRRRTGLPKDSVANVSQIVAVDRDVLSEHAGRLSGAQLELILGGLDVVLGRAG
ncbi:MAG: type II toxin-antitoxin system PemK/MazF family toxin [Actinomycetota bacterium]